MNTLQLSGLMIYAGSYWTSHMSHILYPLDCWSNKRTFDNENDFLSFETSTVPSRTTETMSIIFPTHFFDEE